jgi:hypothetical protein
VALHTGLNAKVRIYRAGYLCVSKYFLYDFRVLLLLEDPGSKRVSEGIEADALRQPNFLEKPLEIALSSATEGRKVAPRALPIETP